ncbi:MAG TPA: VOC family protein [Gemmatimonadales bacterium]|nr:VOC family protein [Gemmatimonadales bacterium]
MLGDNDAIATIPVRNIDVARSFYQDKLGLMAGPSEERGVLTCKSGASSMLVYESKYAGTNEATAATWAVDDVDGMVRSLKEKGVTFEHYDMPNMKREGDVHVSGSMKAAWFKDPDGNILAVVSR